MNDLKYYGDSFVLGPNKSWILRSVRIDKQISENEVEVTIIDDYGSLTPRKHRVYQASLYSFNNTLEEAILNVVKLISKEEIIEQIFINSDNNLI
jgi:hypothetical protein